MQALAEALELSQTEGSEPQGPGEFDLQEGAGMVHGWGMAFDVSRLQKLAIGRPPACPDSIPRSIIRLAGRRVRLESGTRILQPPSPSDKNNYTQHTTCLP